MEDIKDFRSRKFLLPAKNYKLFEKDILNREGVLAPYGIEFNGNNIIEKVFFDTVDRFFFANGIMINLVKDRNASVNKIIVRYQGETKRIQFVSDLPTLLSKEINKRDFFSAHFDFIADAIKQILPAGLGVDIPSYVSSIIPVFVVIKKAKRYRVINNNGLKMVFSFEDVEYINNANRNRAKLLQFEIKLEDESKEELFDKFVKRLILQVPTIIQMKDSDLLNGLDYTSKTDEKPKAKTPIK